MIMKLMNYLGKLSIPIMSKLCDSQKHAPLRKTCILLCKKTDTFLIQIVFTHKKRVWLVFFTDVI